MEETSAPPQKQQPCGFWANTQSPSGVPGHNEAFLPGDKIPHTPETTRSHVHLNFKATPPWTRSLVNFRVCLHAKTLQLSFPETIPWCLSLAIHISWAKWPGMGRGVAFLNVLNGGGGVKGLAGKGPWNQITLAMGDPKKHNGVLVVSCLGTELIPLYKDVTI